MKKLDLIRNEGDEFYFLVHLHNRSYALALIGVAFRLLLRGYDRINVQIESENGRDLMRSALQKQEEINGGEE